MNFDALTIDELAALCATSPMARKYAGDNFARLVNQLHDEFLDQLLEQDGVDYSDPEPFPWLDDSIPLEWWEIS